MSEDILGESIWKTMPPLYSQEKAGDPMVYAKLFSPGNEWMCYITEGDRSNGRLVVYGLFIGNGRRWGQLDLDELRGMAEKNRARLLVDTKFTATRLSLLTGTCYQACHAG